ncbi:MAG: hypothetical protein PHY77_01215 [Desulfotomaculaceae bacterium]|nr:hypothetical protein [Desulfotomaculaceae bacterium]
MTNCIKRAVGDPTNECIRVPKVYDWVTLNVDEVKNVTIPAASLTLINDAIAAGNQLNVVVTVDPATDIDVNVFNVTRKIVNINGVDTSIGCAQILKTVTLHISVFSLGTPTVPIIPPALLTSFDSTLQFFERAGVCFPAEFTADNIISHVQSVEAFSLTSFPVDGQFMLQILICQDLQVETEVKLEVLGRFCTPRDNNIDCTTGQICNPITFPEQCPNLYPAD